MSLPNRGWRMRVRMTSLVVKSTSPETLEKKHDNALLGTLAILVGAVSLPGGRTQNHDFDVIRDEAKAPPYQLPPLLVSAEGKLLTQGWSHPRETTIRPHLALKGHTWPDRLQPCRKCNRLRISGTRERSSPELDRAGSETERGRMARQGIVDLGRERRIEPGSTCTW